MVRQSGYVKRWSPSFFCARHLNIQGPADDDDRRLRLFDQFSQLDLSHYQICSCLVFQQQQNSILVRLPRRRESSIGNSQHEYQTQQRH